MGDNVDMGFAEYFSSVDCLIMGRKTMDMISSMDLTSEQWPYSDTRIIVLSHTLKEPPKNLKNKVEFYSGDIQILINQLEKEGYKHAYIDGGQTIQYCLNLKIINEITITQVPILIGEGKPLFSNTQQDIKLENAEAKVFPNDFIQTHYQVNYQ